MHRLTIRYGGCLEGHEEVRLFKSRRELRRYLGTQSPVLVGGRWHVLCHAVGNKNELHYVPAGPTPKLLGTFVIDES